MMTSRSIRSARILSAALSRRRALKSAAGVAGLALAGSVKSGAVAATATPRAAYYRGLPRAALVPADLPDGLDFGVASGTSFLGVDGGTASRVLDETLLAALADTAETLVGGHITILQPLGNQVNRTISTRLFQFETPDDAGDVLARFAAGAFPSLQEITPDDARGRFFAGLLDQGSSAFAQEIVLFRAADVVTIIMISDRTGRAAPEPLPGEPAERLEALRRAVALRLRDVADPEFAGLRLTIPSVAEFAAASDGRLELTVNWWFETFSQLHGQPIRQRFQTDEDAKSFRDDHPGLMESVNLMNIVPTFGGNSIAVRIDGHRFGATTRTGASNLKALRALRTVTPDPAAKDHFDKIEENAQASAAARPEFDAQPADPPPDAPQGLATKWFTHRLTTATSQTVQARGWALNGSDVVGVGIEGPPRTPEENDDADYLAALFGLAALALSGYKLANNLDRESEDDLRTQLETVYGAVPKWCNGYDERVAPS